MAEDKKVKRGVDRRGVLDETPFAYRMGKDKKVFVSWHGRQVTVLKGKSADKFLAQIKEATAKDAQLIMAKVTGNFKRGNERR